MVNIIDLGGPTCIGALLLPGAVLETVCLDRMSWPMATCFLVLAFAWSFSLSI